jgi:hypothetical protein
MAHIMVVLLPLIGLMPHLPTFFTLFAILIFYFFISFFVVVSASVCTEATLMAVAYCTSTLLLCYHWFGSLLFPVCLSAGWPKSVSYCFVLCTLSRVIFAG